MIIYTPRMMNEWQRRLDRRQQLARLLRRSVAALNGLLKR